MTSTTTHTSNNAIIGFETIEEIIINNFVAKTLHHGIIIAGKKGIGKASFAKYIGQKIVNYDNNFSKNIAEKPTKDSLKNSLADFRIIEKIEDKKSIGIDELRNQFDFLNHTSAISSYKFVIIDALCELTLPASNTLLKNLEEPKKDTFYFLITHNLSKVIPTIRSRCLILKVPEFSNAVFTEVLAQKHSNFNLEEQSFLANLCDNCPGVAIESGVDLIKVYQLFLRSLLNQNISEELFKKIIDKNDKNSSYAIIEKILLHFYSQLLKLSNNINIEFFFEEREVFNILLAKFKPARILELSSLAMLSLNNCQKLNLDKKLNFLNIFNQICYD